jgi:hypothetical protein
MSIRVLALKSTVNELAILALFDFEGVLTIGRGEDLNAG